MPVNSKADVVLKAAHRPALVLPLTQVSPIPGHKHRLPLKTWLFFCVCSWVIVSFPLRACQSAQPPFPPPNPSSSLSVVDADMSHLEALLYMCCIDISVLTFPFTQEAWWWSSCNDVKKETQIPAQQLWANECVLDTFLLPHYGIAFSNRLE